METLHFYTIGKDYQRLMENFFEEGSFKTFEALCKDGNFTNEQLKECFELKLRLKGDSRDAEGMIARFAEKSPENFNETLITAIRTAVYKYKKYYNQPILKLEEISKEDENIKILLNYFSIEEIYEKFNVEILESLGFKNTTLFEAVSENITTGLLLQDGSYIECEDQDHINLFPILIDLNMIESGDRLGHHDSDAIVISSNQICGSLGFNLARGSFDYADKSKNISNKQLEELWKVRNFSIGFYGKEGEDSLGECIRSVWVEKLDKGAKYGNLKFLETFYPEIPLCNFFENYLLIEPKKLIIRTSPTESIPGLLNSIVCNTKSEMECAIDQIKSDFEKVKKVKFDNDIRWFYQDFIEGQNGVLNCFEKHSDEQPGKTMSEEFRSKNRYDIYIACSNEQGAIVKGEIGNIELGFEESGVLRRIARTLADDFKSDIQLEFVKAGEGDVKIVQFRTLKNKPTTNFNPTEEELKKAIIVGKTFSTGCSKSTWYNYRNIKIEDVLVVEQDGESSLLLGKKALIVTNDTTFSHLLALSKALNIPSIYATGPIDFKDKETVDFSTQYMIGYVK